MVVSNEKILSNGLNLMFAKLMLCLILSTLILFGQNQYIGFCIISGVMSILWGLSCVLVVAMQIEKNIFNKLDEVKND